MRSADPGGTTRFGYRPALDGVRAFAVLAVLAFHAEIPETRGGGVVGVETFFVLSGFLITALLVEERERSGRIHLGSFYVRRALRLLPALFAVVIASSVYAAVFPNRILSPHTLTSIPYVLFYVANYRGVSRLGLFGQTWSLGVEEQFYILWPALVVAVLAIAKSYKWLVAVTLTLAIGSTAWRFALVGSATHKRFGAAFDVRAAGLLFGCAAAIAYMRSNEVQRKRAQVPILFVGMFSALVLLLFVTFDFEGRPRTTYASPLLLVELAALGVILSVVISPDTPVARLLSKRLPVAIGRISYGLYLWHFPAYAVIRSLLPNGPRVLTVILDFSLAFALAAASFKVIEQPALRLKARWARRVRLDVSAPD
jgi:peptidoglycan/LPS O-acetylase OafA/YrhL